jgi:hypothetical protein
MMIGASIEPMMVEVAQFNVTYPIWFQQRVTFFVFINRLIDTEGIEVIEIGMQTTCSP